MAKSQTPATEPIDKHHAPEAEEQVLPPFSKVEFDPFADAGTAPSAPEAPEESPSGLKKFECWQARPEYLFRMNPKTGEQERYLADIEKTGAKPLFTTHIEQHHADTLNAQVENSGQYYFPI
jgi:hypothetical protein